MPLTFNGNTPAAVTYNGNPVSEVTYNGVTVWSAAPASTPTKIYCSLISSWLVMGVYLTQVGSDSATIDWGDNSPTETSSAQTIEFDHTYAAAGDYIVTVTCSSGAAFSMDKQSYTSRTDITKVEIGDGIAKILSSAFANVSSLTELKIGNSTSIIDLSAFQDCTGLTSVVIGNGMANMRQSCFNGCSSLASITVNATTPPSLGRYAFTGVPADCAIYVPADSVAAYQAASQWSSHAAYIQAIP